MENVLELSDEEILVEAHKLRVGYGMKRTLRYDTKRDFSVHNESDAEHVFALIYLAHYFLLVEPVGPTLNAEKLFSILMFHDFGEIIHGDAVTYFKTKAHIDREREASREVLSALPEVMQQVAFSSWQEYEDHESPEAHFAYALDKIEPLFELLDSVNSQSVKRLKITYEMHVGNKFKVVENYPIMKRFTEVVSTDMHKRGVFWEE